MSIRACVAALVAACCVPSALAGDLTPPGAPGPTMKTLDQIEPSIPIGPLTTPGDAASTYRIIQPGAYHLTGELVGDPGKSGIVIAAPDVTIDLRGFTLVGAPAGANAFGIACFLTAGTADRIAIRNGRLTGWDDTGVFIPLQQDSVVEDVVVAGPSDTGIIVGANSAVRRCVVTDVVFSGIQFWTGGGVVESCRVRGTNFGV